MTYRPSHGRPISTEALGICQFKPLSTHAWRIFKDPGPMSSVNGGAGYVFIRLAGSTGTQHLDPAIL